jgi:hypothetical protein
VRGENSRICPAAKFTPTASSLTLFPAYGIHEMFAALAMARASPLMTV